MSEAPMTGPSRPSWLPRRHATRLLALLATAILVAGVAAVAQTPDTNKTVLVLPPLRWDPTGQAWTYATEQTSIELSRTMGDLNFGMPPEEVSKHLPGVSAALHWGDLPQASEYTEDVRYMWIPMQAAGALRAPVASCFGDGSYVVLLFLNDALFRASWRFLASQNCPDPHGAGEELFAAYVPLAPEVAVSSHYSTGSADVVDVTDPAAGPLIAKRWQMRAQ